MDTQKMTTKASVLHGPKDVRIESRELNQPGAREVQIGVRATGICGSDVHYYQHYRNGDIRVQEPLSLGHESVGVVLEVGSEVSNLRIGDRIALEVGVPCGNCDRCNEKRYNICSDLRFRSSAKSYPHAQGTMQDVINHPAQWCYLLPAQISFELGALIEPLSVGIHAVRRARLPPKAMVLVIGAGAIGLLVGAVCRDSGATVAIADIDAGRVAFAVKNRFADISFVMPTKRSSSTEESLDMAQNIAKSIAGVETGIGNHFGPADAVFECTGVPSCMQTAIYATRAGGNVTIIGMGTPNYTLPVSAAALREVDLLGSFRYANAYPAAIDLLSKTSSTGPGFEKLITHRFHGLEAVPGALEMACRKQDDEGGAVIKVVLTNGTL